jgi:ubiquinone/menaquinone biosynthesis C-methylase UbiE
MREQTQAEMAAVRREYDGLAADYDRRWRTYVDTTLEAVVGSVHLQGQERVLDIACGTGELERLALARWPGLQIVGTDISLGMLRQALTKKLNSNASWVLAAAARLPLQDCCFDYAICANSFHYFCTPLTALQEVHRVLRPNGQFVLVDWCDDYSSCKLCSVWLRLTDPAFSRTYTMRACRSLLEQAGFEVVQADHFRVKWIWGMMRFVCRRIEIGRREATELATSRRAANDGLPEPAADARASHSLRPTVPNRPSAPRASFPAAQPRQPAPPPA